MSWLFSQALVEDCLQPKNSGSGRSVPWNWIGTADAFLHSDKMSDTYATHSRYGMTFVPLTADRGVAELMSSLEDFLARRTARPPEGATTPTIFGLKCAESWQMQLPGTYLPRTLAGKPLKRQRKTSFRWVMKPEQLPLERRTWVATTFGSGIGYLHTPTTKANYAAPSMQKWPSARAFTTVFGRPSPTIHDWMMAWPEGWSDTRPLETAKFLLWRQQLCGHLRMLTADSVRDAMDGTRKGAK